MKKMVYTLTSCIAHRGAFAHVSKSLFHVVVLRRWGFIVIGLCYCGLVFAQTPYTEPRYDWHVEQGIVYGQAVDYGGFERELHMDIYKPVCDFNPARPLFVIVHGGAFLRGSERDGDVAALCRNLAQRGIVAASISYRLGFHLKGGNFDPGLLCNADLKCLQALDSTEVIRAVYRGMQDAKGAIRFLKSRHALDSTDVDNVFIGGSSAGGFIALYTGFLDPEEKPAACFALPDAPPPSPLFPNNCSVAALSRARPDLGSVEGELHLGNGYDASVRGVANFMGGMLENILPGERKPALYLYHQTDDLVVGYGRARPFALLRQHCDLVFAFCTPLFQTWPIVHGSSDIQGFAAEMGSAGPLVYADVINNGFPSIAACLTGNNHSIVSFGQRVDNLMGFLGPLIAASGNVGVALPALDLAVSQSGDTLIAAEANASYQWIDCGSGLPIAGAVQQSFVPSASGSYAVQLSRGDCEQETSDCIDVTVVSAGEALAAARRAQVFPNPNTGRFTLELPWPAEAALHDAMGRLLFRQPYAAGEHELALDAPPGVYLLVLRHGGGVQVVRVVRG
jgi:dienelactone hydrolase